MVRSNKVLNEIMRLILSNQEDIKRLMLSKSAIELYKYCAEKRGAMTRQVSADFNISIQDASMRLSNLHKLGYLTRTEITAESGGIEFIYYPWE